MPERNYLLLLSSFIPFGPVRIKLLISFFGSAQKTWKADGKELRKIGIREEMIRQFLRYKNQLNIKEYFNRLKKSSINYLTIKDKNYPFNLKDLEGAPQALYFKGKLKPVDANSVAIVGSRKMTDYGKKVAEKLSSELVKHGITIISGLARGVDTAAHQSALKAGGRTIAVLGSGLNTIYPPENFKLAGEIVKNGALISEYPLDYPISPVNFPLRNRIISGLAKAVIVVEGAIRSGTLLTASHAAEQGKTVFAVPGQINSPLSEAPLFLLKNGAQIITGVEDVLREIK